MVVNEMELHSRVSADDVIGFGMILHGGLSYFLF